MKASILVALLATSGSLFVRADTMSYALTANGTATDSSRGWATVVTIPKLDVLGAIMTGIEVQMTSDMTYTISNVNGGSVPLSYSYGSDASLVLRDQSLGLAWSLALDGLASYQPTHGTFLAAQGPFSVTIPAARQTVTSSVSGPAVDDHHLNPLMQLVGTGTWSLSVFGDQFGPDGLANGPFLIDSMGRKYRGISVDQSADIDVTYAYEVVSEPRCVPLCGLLLFCSLGYRMSKMGLPVTHVASGRRVKNIRCKIALKADSRPE